MRVRILYHDHCFDGAASAAFFSRFYRSQVRAGCGIRIYRHGAQGFAAFRGRPIRRRRKRDRRFQVFARPAADLVVRSSPERVLESGRCRTFQARSHRRRRFTIHRISSCTMFIATVAREKFGFEAPDLEELVQWADIIDGAQLRERAGGGGAARARHAADAGDRRREGLGDRPEDHPLDAALPAGRDYRAAGDPEDLRAALRAAYPLHRYHPEARRRTGTA